MRFSIIGTGAIGGFYGALLVQAGADVHFLLHSDYEHVNAQGLTIQSNSLGTIRLESINAYRRVTDMPVSDVVLIALKSTDNKTLLPQLLPPLLQAGTVVIPIQNGLGVEADLAAAFPTVDIVGGIAQITAYKTAPGVIYHQDYGHLELGNYNLTDASRLQAVSAALQKIAVPVSIVADLAWLRWRKLVWNIPFNGLCTLLNTTTDQLITQPAARALVTQLMREVIRGANACGVGLDEAVADELLAFTGRMQPYSPSMKLDYEQGRALEIKYIYQVPIQQARNRGYLMAGVDMLAQQLTILTQQALTDRQTAHA